MSYRKRFLRANRGLALATLSGVSVRRKGGVKDKAECLLLLLTLCSVDIPLAAAFLALFPKRYMNLMIEIVHKFTTEHRLLVSRKVWERQVAEQFRWVTEQVKNDPEAMEELQEFLEQPPEVIKFFDKHGDKPVAWGLKYH